jgi:nitroimidazol reductase NimA-like FMN-containing flavoprotein (pyridoxamine 5'-phosphate oxidase superfamily)
VSRITSSSVWDEPQIKRFLADCVIPIRLGCLDSKGSPLICSLWFLYDDNALWCATQQSASVAKMLQANPQCGFEVAPEAMPYRGVRGQGQASLSVEHGAAVLARLVDRYLGDRESDFARWLLARAADEVAIKITPDYFTSWDFSRRMSS